VRWRGRYVARSVGKLLGRSSQESLPAARCGSIYPCFPTLNSQLSSSDPTSDDQFRLVPCCLSRIGRNHYADCSSKRPTLLLLLPSIQYSASRPNSSQTTYFQSSASSAPSPHSADPRSHLSPHRSRRVHWVEAEPERDELRRALRRALDESRSPSLAARHWSI